MTDFKKHPLLPLLALFAGLLASCEKPEATASLPEKKDGMVKIEGGVSTVGSEGSFQTPVGKKDFPEEAPMKEFTVDGFWIDETEVTNDQFAAFVKATDYVTFAEQEADVSDFPPEALASLPPVPFNQGSLVFTPPADFEGDPNEPGAFMTWWRWDPSANWQHPEGEGSSIKDKGNHPVVCVNFDDATAYAKWAGKRLPTEAEWELAARGGLKNKLFTWGDEMKPDGKWMANTFQGDFPANNTSEDSFSGSSPAKSFSPNGFGLYDMAGNVWEICSDYYDPEFRAKCVNCEPTGPETWFNRNTGKRGEGSPSHITKGGSFLCHISYCMRYRPAARHSIENDSPANHIGFRCAKDL